MIILGLQYYPSGTELAEQFDAGWRYGVMPHRNSDELFHFQENQIQPLTPEELGVAESWDDFVQL